MGSGRAGTATSVRAALLAALTLSLAFAPGGVAPIGAAESPAAAGKPLIVAHYMGWYRTESFSGSWGHWQINRDNIPKRFWRFPDLRNRLGWRQSSNVHYPVIGLYDSADPDLCEYHILLARLAGIDAFVCDWYGEGHDYEDVSFKVMRDLARDLDFKVAICWEDQSLFPGYAQSVTTRGEAVELGKRTLSYLEREWFSAPSYLRLDGRPVLTSYAWGSPGPTLRDVWLSADEWDTVLSSVAVRPVFLHDWHGHYWRDDDFSRFESLLPWGDNYHGNNDSIPSFWNLSRELLGRGRFAFLSGTVLPGFDNRGCGGWGTGSAIGFTRREGGAKFRATWDDVVAQSPRVIQVATWNDLNEGGTIEPVRLEALDDQHAAPGYGYRELETVQEYAARLKGFAADRESLRVPARIYAARKMARARFAEAPAERDAALAGIDAARTLLLAGKTSEARAAIDAVLAEFPENLRSHPDLAVYEESLPEPIDDARETPFDAWGIQACDPLLGPRYQTTFEADDFRPYPGRRGILLVRPMSSSVATMLNRVVTVPPSGGALRFSVSPNATMPGRAGFRLAVRVNGEEKRGETIRAVPGGGWRDVTVDLSPLAGRRAAIEIGVAAVPTIGWDFSDAYFADLRIDGVDPAAFPETLRFGGWMEAWSVTSASDFVEPEFRDTFAGRPYAPPPGRSDVLFLHPVSLNQPARIARSLWIPASGSTLRFSAAANARKTGADFVLRVRGDDRILLDTLVARGRWRDYAVDLSAFADTPVSVAIECAAGGTDRRGAEEAFLAGAFLEGVDPPASVPTDLQGEYARWSVIDCDLGKGPWLIGDYRYASDKPHPGRSPALVVHPERKERPCRLLRDVRVVTGDARLSFSASANIAHPNTSDFVLVVRANGETLVREVIAAGERPSRGGWRDFTVELGRFEGQAVALEIEVGAGGAKEWAWEHGFIAGLALTGAEEIAPRNDAGWRRAWTVTNSGKDVVFARSFAGQSDYPHPGREQILVLHPKEPAIPCRMTRTVSVPDSGAALRFAVSADAAQLNNADCLLRVKAAGETLLERVISAGSVRSAAGWREIRVDLARFAGRRVPLVIEIAAGGANPWAWEYAFLADVRVEGVDR